MAQYYVNKQKQDNGDHEVHKSDCDYLPNEENRIYLGEFTSCHGAVEKAKEHFPQSNGCIHCSPECHTG